MGRVVDWMEEVSDEADNGSTFLNKENCKMQRRTLGKSGLEVSAIGLDCMGISFSYNHQVSKGEAGAEEEE